MNRRYAIALGLFAMTIGTVLGIQCLQAVEVAKKPMIGGAAAFHDAYLLGAFVAMLGIVAAAFVRRTPRRAYEPAEVRSRP